MIPLPDSDSFWRQFVLDQASVNRVSDVLSVSSESKMNINDFHKTETLYDQDFMTTTERDSPNGGFHKHSKPNIEKNSEGIANKPFLDVKNCLFSESCKSCFLI